MKENEIKCLHRSIAVRQVGVRKSCQYVWAFLIFLMSVSILVNLTGCAVNRCVSPSFTKLIDDMPFKAEYPIAREIGITYSYTQELDGKLSDPAICSNEKNQPGNTENSSTTPWYNMPQPTSTTKWSEIYDQKATDARFRGDFSNAKFYSQSAANSLEVEIAMENMVNNVNTAFATYNATVEVLRVISDAIMKNKINKTQEWIINTNGCIGDTAPEGSILHLDMKWILHGNKFQLDSKNLFVVTAVLEDGKGNNVQSVKSFELYAYKENKPADSSEFISFTQDTIPAEKQAAYEPMKKLVCGQEHVLLVNSAIADLYTRIIALKEMKKGKR